jgi:hypothetical protein
MLMWTTPHFYVGVSTLVLIAMIRSFNLSIRNMMPYTIISLYVSLVLLDNKNQFIKREKTKSQIKV